MCVCVHACVRACVCVCAYHGELEFSHDPVLLLLLTDHLYSYISIHYTLFVGPVTVALGLCREGREGGREGEREEREGVRESGGGGEEGGRRGREGGREGGRDGGLEGGREGGRGEGKLKISAINDVSQCISPAPSPLVV